MTWTASLLAYVLLLTAEDIFKPNRLGVTTASRLEWRWIDHAQRLVWLYGADEALRRLNADPEPQKAAA